MSNRYGIRGYPSFAARRRGTRGKGRKINYDKKPRNFRKLIEAAVQHITVAHGCEICIGLSDELQQNLLSPFGIRCYNCDKPITDSKLHVEQSGAMLCQECANNKKVDYSTPV
tara:strand:- start:652 stop:990 length:339 start_codon:yes stop_codon:yes gene_type:complete